MEYGLLEIAGGVAGGVLCLLAVFVLNPDGISRATEAIFERIEIRLALRQQKMQRRAARAEVQRGSIRLVESWQQRSS